MKKWLLVIAGLIIVLLIGAGFAYASITGSSTVNAQLNVESGSVMVNGQEVSGTVKLSEGDKISTGSDGKASVILYESIVVQLKPNTQITLEDLAKEHPVVNQESGETFSKFTGLAGVQEYSVKSGNSVASVRGTAFSFGNGKIMTGEGEVQYVVGDKQFSVKSKQVVEIVDGNIVQRAATAGEISDMVSSMQETVETMKEMRISEINKHPTALNYAKSKYGLTDESIKSGLNDADEGKIDLKEMAEQAPMKIDSLNKIVDLTEQIKKIKQDIQQLNG